MKNVYSISSQDNFLATLASELLTRYSKDPLQFADCHVFLPNRRSCLTLANELQAQSGTTILPRIFSLGEIENDPPALLLDMLADPHTPTPLSSLAYHALLQQHITEKFPHYSYAESKEFSTSLAKLFDTCERESIAFSALHRYLKEQSDHHQHMLSLLRRLSKSWPEFLAQKNYVSYTAYRELLLKTLATLWQKNPPNHPIIIAGTTGSIHSTAAFIQSILTLPHIMVILPDLDTHIEEDGWQLIGPSHSQYSLKKLLERLGKTRKEVTSLPAGSRYCALFSELMRPAEQSEYWHHAKISAEAASHLTSITAEQTEEEAHIIALLIRHHLEQPHKKIAIVTPHDLLTKRLIHWLVSANIPYHHSQGSSMVHTPEGQVFNAIARATATDANVHDILSFLKHPALAKQLDQQALGQIEINYLRGATTAFPWQASSELETIYEQLAPLKTALSQPHIDIGQVIPLHLALTEAIFDTPSDEWQYWAEELRHHSHYFASAPASSYADLCQEWTQSHRCPNHSTDPRAVHILTPMEARLHYFDVVILAGLNETIWPETPSPSPWLPPALQHQLGLEEEKNISLSAHDFAALCALPQVYLTRSQKEQGTATVPSRWLERLQTLAAIHDFEAALEPDHPWQKWSQSLHHITQEQPLSPPTPTPPLKSRPLQCSVTDLELLLRDPYSFYAKHILALAPLEQLEANEEAKDFGILVHRICEEWQQKQDIDGQYFASELNPFWQQRLTRITDWLSRHQETPATKTLCEVSGRYHIPLNQKEFTLTAKADCIKQYEQTFHIIDYKTGTPPSKNDITLGFSPQMSIEALIANDNGFQSLSGTTTALIYWQINGSYPPVEINTLFKNEQTTQLIEQTKTGLNTLLTHYFATPNTAFLACPFPQKTPRYQPYQHLTRVKEWR